jgi:RimJ/RimL family protein N-acetyltransferase
MIAASLGFTMTELIELCTPRLRLRQWHPDDNEAFADLNADPRVMEFFPSCLDRAASNTLAARSKQLISERGWGFWAVEVMGGEKFIGFVGLHIPNPELPFSPCVEIGWRLAFTHWGKGYAPEAARAALQFGFAVLNLPEIVSFTAICNDRSRSVMTKLRMREDPETFEHPALPLGHPLREHCLYRLSKKDWLHNPYSIGRYPHP